MKSRSEKYVEKLSEDELAFLRKKAKKQERTFQKLLRVLLLGAMLISFAGAWKNIHNDNKVFNTETIFSWENYFITLITLSVFFLVAMRFSRNTELNKINKDIRQQKKIIERVIIERKTFLPHNNTFHFYLNSLQKLSIEVDEEDFALLEEGDEISIEYAQNSGIYFGYF
jgi:hypothetical protein